MATVNETIAELTKTLDDAFAKLSEIEKLTVLRKLIPKLTNLEEDIMSCLDGE